MCIDIDILICIFILIDFYNILEKQSSPKIQKKMAFHHFFSADGFLWFLGNFHRPWRFALPTIKVILPLKGILFCCFFCSIGLGERYFRGGLTFGEGLFWWALQLNRNWKTLLTDSKALLSGNPPAGQIFSSFCTSLARRLKVMCDLQSSSPTVSVLPLQCELDFCQVCLFIRKSKYKKIQNSKIFEAFFKVFVRFFPPILRKLKASIFLRVAKQPSHYQKIQKYIFFLSFGWWAMFQLCQKTCFIPELVCFCRVLCLFFCSKFQFCGAIFFKVF